MSNIGWRGVIALMVVGVASGRALAQGTVPDTALVVDRTDDDAVGECTAAAGDCTLRGALARAVDGDIIVFDGVVFPANPTTPVQIAVGSQLPPLLAGNVTLVGPVGSRPVVVLDGTFAGEGVHGLVIDSSANYVRGLAIRNFDGNGIEVVGGDYNRLGGEGGCDQNSRQNVYTDNGGYGVHIGGGEVNFIWQSDIGRVGEGNAAGGVLVDGDATYARMVGDCVRIRGNGGPGVHVVGADNTSGNGRVFTSNNDGPGVWFDGATGTDNYFEDITISNNASHGALATGGSASLLFIKATISGNSGDGIHVDGGDKVGFYGGSISNNTGAGLRVVAGNGARIANQVSFSNNGGLGIDLGAEGVTPNDAGDGDTGPNGLINFPVITGAIGAGTNQTDVSGTARPGDEVRVFIANGDPSGHGEGSSTSNFATADGDGNWTLRVYGLALGASLTAIATGPDGSTSEFAANASGPRGPFVVDRSDDGDVRVCSDAANDCTLRGALNAVSRGGTINFDTNVFPAVGNALAATVIAVGSPLPAITASYVVIEGSSGGVPRVILDGTEAGAGVSGLVLQSDWNRVRGLLIRNFAGDGIRVAGGNLNWLGSESCLDSGPNVLVDNGGAGVRVMADAGVIWRGQYIGVLPNGAGAGNGEAGIVVDDGAARAGAEGFCMRVAYNDGPGVVFGVSQDSYFGNDQPGNIQIHHNDGPGVVFDGATGGAVMGVQIYENDGDGVQVIGGANQIVITMGAQITNNRGAGVRVIDGQRVLLGGARIYGNDSLAFDLVAPDDGPDGVTPNDEGDDDSGPNGLLNRPIITSIEGAGTNTVRVRGTACPGCRVWFYTAQADPSGYGGFGANTNFGDANGAGEFDAQSIQLAEGASLTAIAVYDNYITSEPALNVRGPGKIVVDRTDDDLVTGCSDAANDCTLRGALTIAGNGATIGFLRSVFPDVDSANNASAGVIMIERALPVVTVERLNIVGSDGGGSAPVIIDGRDAGDVDGLVLDGREARISGVHLRNFARNGVVVHGTFNFLGKFDGCGGATVTVTDNGRYGVHIDSADETIIGAVRSGLTGKGNTLGGMLVTGESHYNLLNGCYQAIDNDGAGLELVGPGVVETYSQGDVLLSGNLDGLLVDGARQVTVTGAYTNNARDGLRVIGGAVDVRVIQTTVSGNGEVGVRVIDGQDVWVAENAMIRDNGALGIDLVGPDDNEFGVTPNDAGDGDSGPNGLQNYPSLQAVRSTGDGRFNLNGTTCAGCVVNAYRQRVDPSGYGEIESYLGKATADEYGVFSVPVTLGTNLAGIQLTFTATRGFSTSEFGVGADVQVLAARVGSCGNGATDEGEQCDDGGTASGDGCSGACTWEVCGDGVVQTFSGHTEVCDGPCDDGDPCTEGDACDGECGACVPGRDVCGTAPVIEAQVFTIAPGAGVGTVVGTVVASDAEGDAPRFAIVGDAGGLAIDPVSGVITVVGVVSADVTIVVSVTDASGTNSAAVTVRVVVPDACEDNGGCEQTCTDEGGVAVCGCEPGFELASDGKRCFEEASCDPTQSCGGDAPTVYYGMVANAAGEVVGSIRCEHAADGEVTCKADSKGVLVVSEVLWCD